MPFVGRARELKLLLDVFARAAAGSAQVVTLLGEPGIGKTRLAAELTAALDGRALVVRAPWTATPERTPFGPLLRALRDAAGDDAPDPDADLSIDEVRLELLRFGERTLDRTPLVLNLDNLHLADDAMLDLVGQAVDRFRESPLLVLCLARDELLERRPRWGGGRPNAMTLGLHPLRDELAAEVAGALEPRVRDWVVAAAEGNPLFVEELVTYVREQGLPPTGELPPPPTLQALVGSRLERLEPEELAVLRCAAVVGRTFETAPVELLHGAPVDDALRSLERRGLLRRWRGGHVFHHQLLLEVVYRSIPRDELADLHRRVADWYESSGGADAMALRPMHLYRAYDYEPDPGLRHDVARSLAFAGRRMSARGNVNAAVAALERAIELVDEDERLPLLYELANTRAEAGEMAEAEKLWREAERQAKALGDRRAQLHVRLARGDSITMHAHDFATAEQVAREAIEEFERLGDARGLSRAWERLRLVYSYACRGADALDAAQRAVGYAREAGAEEDVLRLLPMLAAQHYWGPTPAEAALEELERILAELGSHPSGRGNLLWMIGGLHAMLGRFDTARSAYREAHLLNVDLGRTIRDAGMAQVGAAIELLAGEPAAAEAELRRGLAVLEQAGETEFRSSVAAWLGRALLARGRIGDALAAGATALELADEGDAMTAVVATSMLAEAHARRGDEAESDRYAERARASIAAVDEPIARADALADLGVAAIALGRDPEPLLAEADAVYAAKGSVAGRARLTARRTTARPPARS
jgi:tetratricopeptide (TPR) repeat protein